MTSPKTRCTARLSYHDSVKSALQQTDALFIAHGLGRISRVCRRRRGDAPRSRICVIDGQRMIPDYAELTDLGIAIWLSVRRLSVSFLCVLKK
jgi:hypothetical protein